MQISWVESKEVLVAWVVLEPSGFILNFNLFPREPQDELQDFFQRSSDSNFFCKLFVCLRSHLLQSLDFFKSSFQNEPWFHSTCSVLSHKHGFKLNSWSSVLQDIIGCDVPWEGGPESYRHCFHAGEQKTSECAPSLITSGLVEDLSTKYSCSTSYSRRCATNTTHTEALGQSESEVDSIHELLCYVFLVWRKRPWAKLEDGDSKGV